MRRLSFVFYIILVLSISFFNVIFSYNVILRVPETYIYHFNDSQATYNISANITGGDIADEIASYFNSPFIKEFQIYEKNGNFKDPIFEKKETEIMKKSKKILGVSAFAGIVLFVVSILTYIYLMKNTSKSKLRKTGYAAIGISALLQIISVVCLNIDAIRKSIYGTVIGISTGKDSLLNLLIGSPFEATVSIFSSIITGIFIGIFVYIHYKITKEEHIFY